MNPRRFHGGGSAGFSLVELMVALTAGAFVVSSAYFIGAASTRHFQEQQRIGQVQTAVRLAMEQIQRDVARAGYLGTPHTRRDPRCQAPPVEFGAVEFLNDADNGRIPNAAANGVGADRLRLVGSYHSNDSFLVRSLSAAGDSVWLQRDWQAFRRNFGAGPIAAGVDDPFGATFRRGRMLRIRNTMGRTFYATITGANPADGSVSFAPAIPPGGTCTGGLLDGATVSVLSRIEYLIDDGSSFDSAALGLALDGENTTGRRTFLIRREIGFDNAPIAGTERIVLENAVDFELSFVLDREDNPALPPNLQRFDGMAAAPLLADVAGNAASVPHQVRAVRVSLSARTSDVDPRFPFVARGPGEALTRFNPGTTGSFNGAARVRTVQAEVFLPNLRSR
jgi:prepilin-type N-terminal cleavage/methylation domain-containing protein